MNRSAPARVAALALTVILAACTSPEPRPPVVAPPPEPVPSPVVVVPPAEPPDLPALMRRSVKPQPTRALNVRAQCQFSDPTGYRGKLKLAVREAEVQQFEAEVTIPKRGVCRFRLKDFTQAERLPNVRLTTADGTCSVRMWEQGARTTVAFSDCADRCSGEAFDYLWPILVESKRGRCS